MVPPPPFSIALIFTLLLTHQFHSLTAAQNDHRRGAVTSGHDDATKGNLLRLSAHDRRMQQYYPQQQPGVGNGGWQWQGCKQNQCWVEGEYYAPFIIIFLFTSLYSITSNNSKTSSNILHSIQRLFSHHFI